MPSEPTPTESLETGPTPTATDHGTASRVADTTGGTDAGRSRGDPTDVPGPEAGDGREAAGPDGDRVAALERRVAELEADLQAVHGLLDGIEAVDERIDRRASAALAKAEALAERVDPGETGLVRERLPDADGDRPREAGGSGRADERRDPNGPQGGVDPEQGVGGDDGRRAAPADTPDSETWTATAPGQDRAPTADEGAADGESAGTGAISSVGGGTPDGETTADEDGAADDPNRSLAARLRDAFR